MIGPADGPLRLVLAALLWLMPALAVLAAVLDLKTRTVPDWIPAVVLVWGLIGSILGVLPITFVQALLGLAVAAVLTMPLFAIRAFGGGDVKLACACAACLGPVDTVLMLIATALAGGLLGLVALARKRATLAYVPAIAAGAVVVAAYRYLA